jgi:hypothetical protein
MITGGCLCGALRYRAEGEPGLQGLCHCRNCQRLTGAGHVGWMCFDEKTITVEGETRAYAATGGSGRPAMRFSCPTCHSIVYGTAEVMPGLINIYAGSLDDTSHFKPQMAIFTRSRPAWDDSSRNLQCFETLPQR